MQESVVEIPLHLIHRGIFQPRELFEPEAMEATKRSIAEKGQKVPVLVRAIKPANPLFKANWTETHYELADGERRYRCCKDLGLKTVKALIRDLKDEEMLDLSMTTNDSLPLNPIERATVFHRLSKDFGKTQSEIAKSFNLKQQQVSELIRLLELPDDLKELTARSVISVRHARELLKVSDADKIREIGREIVEKKLSTRKVTQMVKGPQAAEAPSGPALHRGIPAPAWFGGLKRANLTLLKALWWTMGDKGRKVLPVHEKRAGHAVIWELAIFSSIIIMGLLLQVAPNGVEWLGAAVTGLFIFENLRKIKY